MNLLKKILIHILIIMIILMSCFSIYFANKHGLNIYAAVNDDAIYVPLRSESDVVKSFQAYCKSRDLTIEGSLTDAVTTFTTGAFNSACNEIGIDITELQGEIKAEYDSSGNAVKFLFNDTGVMAMNRIFAQFLQDNELEVGDNDVNKTVYDGYYNNDCLVYVINNNSTSIENTVSQSVILQYGTTYVYTSQDIINFMSDSTDITKTILLPDNSVYNANFHKANPNKTNEYISMGGTSGRYGGYIYHRYYNYTAKSLCLIYQQPSNRLYFGIVGKIPDSTNYCFTQTQLISNKENLQNTVINIVSNTINNNTYEGDTYITNEGDVINNNPTIPYNPYPDGGGPTTPSTGIGDGNGTQLTLPDLDLNLPSINWSIGDLTEKFPFSIPFDLIAFLTILNAEPETPEIQGNLNLAIVNWDFDYDLHQFDDLASLLRNLEFIGFCIGLVLITRSLLR